jgi:very-short-patch-repair endonuclease
MPKRKSLTAWHSPPEAWDAVKPLARQMRREPTAAERLLWSRLRAHRFLGLGFRRQHALDWFVADFYCAEARLVIELDGEGHDAQKEQDAWRDANLAALDLRVLRFRNEEVLRALPVVLGKIAEAVRSPVGVSQQNPTPLPSPRAGRGKGGGVPRAGRARGGDET